MWFQVSWLLICCVFTINALFAEKLQPLHSYPNSYLIGAVVWVSLSIFFFCVGKAIYCLYSSFYAC